MDDNQTQDARALKRSIGQNGGKSKQAKTTKTINILSLPDECLRRVTQNLTQEDTLSLLYSNSHFERACKFRLYRNIIICEKYQDHYFYELSKQKKTTILSGWDNIIKFFRMFYLNSQKGKNLDLAKYFEEISTYNFLDRGRVDPFKVLSKSDLTNILSLRQFWDIAINSFVNLKVFYGPKLPLEKVFSFKETIVSNLRKLSISIDDFSPLGPLEDYDINLPHLKNLKINSDRDSSGTYTPRVRLDFKTCLVLAKLLIVDGSANNTTLEELEINGSFGSMDRRTEHKLRHANLTEGTSLTLSYILGFRNATSSVMKEVPSLSTNGLDEYESDNDKDAADTDEEQEEEGEREYDDDIYNDIAAQFSTRNGSGINEYLRESLDFEPPTPEIVGSSHNKLGFDLQAYNSLPGLRNANFQYFESGITSPRDEFFAVLVDNFVQNGIKLLNLKKLSVANMGFEKEHFLPGSNFLKNFDELFPNSHKLETLDFRQVSHALYIFNENEEPLNDNEEAEFFQNDVPSFITHLTNSIQAFNNLKKLVLYTYQYQGLGEPTEYEHGFMGNHCIKLHTQLQAFSAKTPNLEELVVFGPDKTKLRHFYRILYKSHARKTIKKLTYHQPEIISELCSKILNARIFKKFNKHKNLKMLDDYYFGCSKKIVEHFITTSRVENYCGNELMKYNEDTMFFKDEFLYLFGDDAKRFFRICPKLEEFTLYGFTFERNKNILV
ncbi:hypothetical protein BN7_6088 [Wickerhamomyces ciferrii]|uniref:F-box domain-containing protein n=1 Tax=Wickerhamomyces ciferrii (strain ATCC 14091 / BCRC 22168 / CBS 111 / JCM 3599 / NBRC 0793 / NRRL Y-1031 F-60-10) TaxID=1206466 RepID=K0KMJ0_WICCF|nr:uncharacterized protein BN7_6088 [Wickerhamomyces ciferrii]CCH46495.1 hypothetical protein BN7_6088 [Wickerhamomyces ciferrii]